MLSTFIATLNPLATLFICMGVGFALTKLNILPKESPKVLSKLVIWVLYPALCFITTASYCTPDLLIANSSNLIFACVGLLLSILISLILVRFFAAKSTPEHGVYRYALTFGNSGYMGDPLVLSIFGDIALTIYKIFTIPLTFAIYTWGTNILTPSEHRKSNPIKQLVNPPTVAIFLGMTVGLCGMGDQLPTFAVSTLNSLKACMGPVVMLMAGSTVAEYSIKSMLTNKKTYIITALRLVVIPSVIISLMYLIITVANAVFGTDIGNSSLCLMFFTIATPLGLNTVVFPKAYGNDAELGAGMALISHTLSVISIPLMFSLMTFLFGEPMLG